MTRGLCTSTVDKDFTVQNKNVHVMNSDNIVSGQAWSSLDSLLHPAATTPHTLNCSTPQGYNVIEVSAPTARSSSRVNSSDILEEFTSGWDPSSAGSVMLGLVRPPLRKLTNWKRGVNLDITSLSWTRLSETCHLFGAMLMRRKHLDLLYIYINCCYYLLGTGVGVTEI